MTMICTIGAIALVSVAMVSGGPAYAAGSSSHDTTGGVTNTGVADVGPASTAMTPADR